MAFSFRPAVRENVGLILGLVGGTGSGKTYTAMRLASGIANGRPFAVIDTEAGRSRHYASLLKFDAGDLRAPFRPDAYVEAIIAADQAGYPAIVVDSMSHEHAGDGGLLDWHEEEFKALGGTDKVKMTAWIKPKMAHKRMVQRLLQCRAHLILCFRAEEKVSIEKDPATNKTVIVPKKSINGIDGWIPIAEKTLPYELTASFLFTADKPGFPKPIKMQEQHRALFPLDVAVTEESGKRLAEWASAGSSWMRDIETAPTLAALVSVWKRIPAAEAKAPALKAAKDTRKAQLEESEKAATAPAEPDAAEKAAILAAEAQGA